MSGTVVAQFKGLFSTSSSIYCLTSLSLAYLKGERYYGLAGKTSIQWGAMGTMENNGTDSQ